MKNVTSQVARWVFLMFLSVSLVACAGKSVRETPLEEQAAHQPLEATSSTIDKDPWESMNRKMFAFNNTLDRAILRPVAIGYTKVTPPIVRKGISNFFDNLQQPVTGLNLLLQGHPGQAGSAFGRFLLNATLGLGGILDPATHAGIPNRDNDIGQTLAVWGWDNSRYLVLPIFGPGTVRDGLGKGISGRISPVSWLAREEGAEVSILYGLNARAGALAFDAFLKDAADPYALTRDAYLQRRHCQIVDCSGEMPDYLLPDYDFEVPDFDTLRR